MKDAALIAFVSVSERSFDWLRRLDE